MLRLPCSGPRFSFNGWGVVIDARAYTDIEGGWKKLLNKWVAWSHGARPSRAACCGVLGARRVPTRRKRTRRKHTELLASFGANSTPWPSSCISFTAAERVL